MYLMGLQVVCRCSFSSSGIAVFLLFHVLCLPIVSGSLRIWFLVCLPFMFVFSFAMTKVLNSNSELFVEYVKVYSYTIMGILVRDGVGESHTYHRANMFRTRHVVWSVKISRSVHHCLHRNLNKLTAKVKNVWDDNCNLERWSVNVKTHKVQASWVRQVRIWN